ncbi:phosphonate ABC transporter, permease protein PhnE [Gracilibacillus marinus]|uniref:Phosphonate ABC transporter, permease protein PhnE n=1 Tax=Gracilibacillus marinus TaxID=630535 RepID=A0ABV8VWZ7_9BACI
MLEKIWTQKPIVLDNGRTVTIRRSKIPFILVLIIVGILLSIEFTQFDVQQLIKRWNQFFVIIGEMIPPTWEYIPYIWQPLMDTIKMSLLGTLLGSIASIPVAYMASSNIVNHTWINTVARIFLSLIRTMPTLVSALIATFVFGLGTLAGTVAIFLFTLAYVGKLLYEQIENADMGAFEAMESLGMHRIQTFRYAIFPQIVPNFLSTSLFCFEGNVRYAAILGYVGAGGVGLLLQESLGWRNYANVGMILLVLAITVFLIESVSEHFRKKLV